MATRKLFYKIGEACKILEIEPYVLRFWETEFPFLAPQKSKSGQRVYQEADLDLIRDIKTLLYDDGYTIAGAKKKIEARLQEGAGKATTKTERTKTERTKPERTKDEPRSSGKASEREDASERATAGARGSVSAAAAKKNTRSGKSAKKGSKSMPARK